MEHKILAFIKNELAGDPNAALAPEDDLLNSGLIDSIGIMQLIAFIEQEQGIKIPPQDLTIDNFVSVQAITNYLQKQGA